MGQIQQQMKATLEKAGLPFKSIECYGSQIVITSHCADTANRWAQLLGRFARVRGVIKSLDEASVQRGTCLNRTYVQVYRTFAAVA